MYGKLICYLSEIFFTVKIYFMHTLTDQFYYPVAYIYNNIILLPESFEVIGVKLGDCVFGRQAILKGKYFNGTIYNANGEILARDNGESEEVNFDVAKAAQDSWNLITSLKHHIFPWIVPKEKWSKTRLDKFLID